MEMSPDENQKGKNPPIWKRHMTMIRKEANKSNSIQLQSHSYHFLSKTIHFFQLVACYLLHP